MLPDNIFDSPENPLYLTQNSFYIPLTCTRESEKAKLLTWRIKDKTKSIWVPDSVIEEKLKNPSFLPESYNTYKLKSYFYSRIEQSINPNEKGFFSEVAKGLSIIIKLEKEKQEKQKLNLFIKRCKSLLNLFDININDYDKNFIYTSAGLMTYSLEFNRLMPGLNLSLTIPNKVTTEATFITGFWNKFQIDGYINSNSLLGILLAYDAYRTDLPEEYRVKLLKMYNNKILTHDKTFEFSDDHSVYKNGLEERQIIYILLSILKILNIQT